MTDRELLELAAKAAGLDAKWQELSNPNGGTYTALCVGFGWGDEWNPLTDDGDALRLAVNLQLPIEFWPALKTVAVSKPEMAHCEEKYKTSADEYAATRRAIVRAAAELAKGMK